MAIFIIELRNLNGFEKINWFKIICTSSKTNWTKIKIELQHFHVQCTFPASRGLFSIVFAELTGVRKRDLCPGLKQTVLSMRHSYLVNEPSRDAFSYAGSLNDSGVLNCKQMRERQWAQVTISKQYREHAFCKCRPRLRTADESKSVSTQGKGLFSLRLSVQRIQRKRGLR